jgi:hypothetical protein
MNELILSVVACFIFAATAAADSFKGRQESIRGVERTERRERPERRDRPEHPDRRHEDDFATRSVTFNIFCRYDNGPQRKDRCYAAARFEKLVFSNGAEFEDNSDHPSNPVFEVECGGEMIFNEHGRRFMSREGTWIQALTGPYPAIVLSRQALREGHHRVTSVLELRDVSLEGTCLIYTGEP